jgi:hypothetical protein
MPNPKNEFQRDKRIIIKWLAHHNPEREDFNNHVLYIFNYAVCIGCLSFLLGITVGLILGNLFYSYITNVISIPFILMIFFFCWLPSLFQYSIQIIRKKPLRNRIIKFLIRFLYPLGSLIFIFKSPIWGLIVSIPAGYLIIYIRKIKIKHLKH